MKLTKTTTYTLNIDGIEHDLTGAQLEELQDLLTKVVNENWDEIIRERDNEENV
jgi:S-methylmethionine-dependent homocysteine/selenocysteine methylase